MRRPLVRHGRRNETVVLVRAKLALYLPSWTRHCRRVGIVYNDCHVALDGTAIEFEEYFNEEYAYARNGGYWGT